MNKKSFIRLGVNIDHCATLRQVRGGVTSYPDLLECAELAYAGGADQITIHLREDRRHIQDADLFKLCRWRRLPINLELAPNEQMLPLAFKARPDWICFVPEKRKELTTEGGLDLKKTSRFFKRHMEALKRKGIRVSAFIEPSQQQVEWAAQLGFAAVEFHTGHWVLSRGPEQRKIWQALTESATYAHALGLAVHAGHGLDYAWTKKIKLLPHLEEVNIGHFLVCEALRVGLQSAVFEMKKVLSP
jgi:pyridoxine 5-phosphate synthase